MPTPRTYPGRAPLAALFLALGPIALPLTGCKSQESGALLLATLYANTSAEFDAACQGVYRSAETLLPRLLADRSHAAATEQAGSYGDLPPAIVLDVDETVLDNSPFEVRLLEEGTSYPTGWDEWCNEANADPIPGALEFTRFAASQGVTVFYVTNRKEHLKEATGENLARLGFPMKPGVDTLLMRGGQPDWDSDKTTRRAFIAKDYRIVMLFGDNTGDFVGLGEAQGTPASRRSDLEPHASRWGHHWFMLPNPMYGYWDGAVLEYDYDRSASEIDALRLRAMDARR